MKIVVTQEDIDRGIEDHKSWLGTPLEETKIVMGTHYLIFINDPVSRAFLRFYNSIYTYPYCTVWNNELWLYSPDLKSKMGYPLMLVHKLPKKIDRFLRNFWNMRKINPFEFNVSQPIFREIITDYK